MEQQQFQPLWTKEQLKQFTTMYEGRGHLLSPEHKQKIEQHSSYYNVPFYEGEGDIMSSIHKFGQGFLEGFSANIYKAGDEPQSQAEAMAKNIGHLVGFAPGILSKPFRLLGKGNATRKASQLAEWANKKSIPMATADWATKYAKKGAKEGLELIGLKNVDSLNSVTKFVAGGAARNVAKQAFHLGVASSVGAWRDGIDGMMGAFIGGASAGAVFGVIGEGIGQNSFIDIGKMIANPKTAEKGHTILKAIAGSAYQGGSATAHGATTPEQVYEYLLGAYFGGGAANWRKAKSMEFAQKIQKEGTGGSKSEREAYSKWHDEHGADIAKHKDFYENPIEVQKELIKSQETLFGIPQDNLDRAVAFKIAKELKLEIDRDDYTVTKEGFRDKGEYIDGESVVEVKESQLKEKGYSGTTGTHADAGLAAISGEYGVPSINFVPWRTSKDKIVGMDRKLTEIQQAEAIPHTERAARTLTSPQIVEGKTEWIPRDITKLSQQERAQIAKNYWAVKNAKTVYITAPIEHAAGRNVKGQGVEWAAEFAKNLNKEVYVLDYVTPGKQGWYRWGGKRFERLSGKNKIPPKPPVNMALLGAYKSELSPIVHGSLREFFGKHLKKAPIVNEVKKRARTLAKNQRKEVEDLIEGKANLEKTIKSYKEGEQTDDVITNLAAAEKSLEGVETKLQKLQDTLTEKTIETDTREEIKETVESVNEMEDLEGTTARKTGKKSLQFVTNYMKDFWGTDTGNFTPFAQREARIEISEAVNDILIEITKKTKGTTNNRSEEAVTVINDFLESIYYDKVGPKVQKRLKDGFLNEESRRELRQWVTRRNLGKPVIHLQSDGITFNRMPNDEAPVSRAGNRKLQEEPETVLEAVHKEITGDTGEVNQMLLDHVTIQDKVTGRNVDLDISRFRANNPKEYKALIKNLHKKSNEEGFYIFGGVSDRDKLYFSKYHPETGSTDIKLSHVMRQFIMKDYIDKDGSKKKKRVRLVTAEQLKLSRKEAAKQGLNQAHHDKIFMSNMLYDLSFNGMPANKKSLDIILNPNNDFITGSAKFNKRMQIWFTPAWKGDKHFIRDNYIDKDGNSLLNDKEGYNAIFVNDGDAILKESGLKSLENIQNPEHMDGGIIIEQRLLDTMNKDFGVPESGQNKSFIVSRNPELGAMLGKFMFHGAGDKLSATMRERGIHMIIPDSASKQRGARKQGTWGVDLNHDKLPEIYNIDPTDVRGSFSVFGSDHFFEAQRLPKQVMMNMLQTAFEPMDQKVIDKAFEDIIGERWAGQDKFNDLVVDYLDRAVEGKQNEANVEHIIDNIESVGMRDILRAMKSEHAPELSEAIYQKMLKVTRESLQTDLESGDISQAEFKEYTAEVSEFNSITDRVVKLATDISKQAADNGFDITADSIYNHKFVRDFRMKAVQNFLVNSATKPKLNNSGAAFMRPYDQALQMNLDKANKLLDKTNREGINHNEEVFLLDEGHRAVPIHLNDAQGNRETKPLGVVFERFEAAQKGEYKNYLEDVLTAATVRVPMDSVSGMQVLKFGGFTGRKGHGILLHSRTMRLEGGADLDGDKSFFFFGGNGAMSRDMMQQFYQNRKEFEYTDSKGNINLKDNKKAKIKKKVGSANAGTAIRDLLVTESEGNSAVDLAATNISHYAPAERMRITAAAVDGRNQLGPAVSNSQLMKSAYNSIISAGGTDNLFFKMNVAEKGQKADWVNFKVEIKAKTDSADVEYQRDMSRAQLGLASDPMDELGLKGLDVWKKLLWDSYFEATSVVEKGQTKQSKYTDKVLEHLKDADKLKFDYTNSGIYGHMANLNKALWGRNYKEGRNFNMDEISQLTESAVAINNIPGAPNSFLPRIGNLFHGIEWSDSPYARLNKDAVKYMYLQADKALKSNKSLQELLERSTMKTPENAYVRNVMDMRLWDPAMREEVSKSLSQFIKAVKGTNYEKKMKLDKEYDDKIRATYGHTFRLKELREFAKKADDFIVNDVSDIVTINILNNILAKGNISPERFTLISRKVEDLKKNSYLMTRTRGELSKAIEGISKENAEFMRQADEFFGKEIKDIRSKDDFRTAELDQAQIDAEIKQFRGEKKLTKVENELFDQLMLGSINRGKFLEKINKFEQTTKLKDRLSMDFIKHLRDLNSKTAVSRLGFSSLEIEDASVSRHLKGYMEMMSNNHRPLNKKQLQELGEIIDAEVKMPPDTPTKLDKIARHSGWGAVKEGAELRSESMGSVVTDIVSLLKNHPEIVGDKSGYALNNFMRGLPFIAKDIEAMTNNDFKMVRNWLRQTKQGTIWQRIQRLVGGEKAAKSLAWRSYQQLIPTLNRELMATDIQLMKQEGFFTDKQGKVQRGEVAVPTQFMDRLSNSVSRMMEAGVESGDVEVTKFQEAQLFYQGLTEAPALWEVAVREREWNGRHEYEQNAIKYGKNPEEIRNNINHLKHNWIKSHKTANWTKIRNQEFYVNRDGKRVLMTGEAIVKKINDNLTTFMKDMHEVITGKEGALDAYRIGYYDALTKESPRYDHKIFLNDLDTYLNGKVPRNWKKFMKSTNESVPSIFGIDGIRAMMREMFIAQNLEVGRKLEKSKDKDSVADGRNMLKVARKMSMHPIKKTGKLNFETYFPRMFYDPAIIKKTLKKAQDEIANDPGRSRDSKIKDLAKLQFKLRRLDGDYSFDDLSDTDVYDTVMRKIAEKETITESQMDRWFDIDIAMGNMRTRENSTPGWSATPTSVEAYARSLSNTYFKGLAGMLTRDIVSNPTEGIYAKLTRHGKWSHSQAQAWTNFAKLYSNDALGNPVTISKKMIENPDMKLKYSPYSWWADNKMADRVNRVGKRLGLGHIIPKGSKTVKVDKGAVKFISGMQDGADVMGVEWARKNGYEVGGTAPVGFAAESGKKPDYYNLYNAREVDSYTTKEYKGREKKFGPRTEKNVKNSDLTILFGDHNSPGSKLTIGLAKKHKKPILVNPQPADIKSIMKSNKKFATINIAGNRPAKLAQYYPNGIEAILNEGFGKRKSETKTEMQEEQYIGAADEHTMRRWSQMEAKYEMATLLAHPKSAMANILGGTLHTLQSTGYSTFKKVYNYEYLQQIDPSLKSRKDVDDMVVKHGVLPQWLIYEMGLQKEFHSNEGKKALKVISDAITRNPEMEAGEMTTLLRSKGGNISEAIVNKAAKFMTIPERRLRTDAFMAHYIQAWEKFGGAIQDPHHPFLIEMGKKGVKATQFMYSAPFRPAFARTAFGKIFTRFQMYAWNSLALRGDVMRRLEVAGYDPNSKEGKEAGRFLIGDMFMLSLANMFAYSLFESNLPQPYGWYQDTADWVFGNETERDRAFFGAYPSFLAPLQVITPPALRLVGPIIKGFLEDDFSRMANYHIHTLYPFGRIGRDLYGQGGVLEAPIRAVDKFSGIPMMQIQREAKAIKKAKESGNQSSLYPRGIIGGYE